MMPKFEALPKETQALEQQFDLMKSKNPHKTRVLSYDLRNNLHVTARQKGETMIERIGYIYKLGGEFYLGDTLSLTRKIQEAQVFTYPYTVEELYSDYLLCLGLEHYKDQIEIIMVREERTIAVLSDVVVSMPIPPSDSMEYDLDEAFQSLGQRP